MNNNVKKLTALALSVAILAGAGATGVYAAKDEESSEKPAVTATSSAPAAPAAGVNKDETVYVLSGADGKTKKVIVSSWLENSQKADSITDLADLRDIENVKGEEGFTTDASGHVTWNAAGEDIYYQGTTDKKVPVDMTVSYRLDGKALEPAEMAGKSGKVTIRFDFQNTQYEEVQINGKQQKVSVPFVMLTGTMLDTEVFRNVTVKNGKTENLGNQIAVLGIALPGMQENLKVGKDQLDIPDFVEISADVENFSMGPTLTVATAEPLGKLNTEKLDGSDIKDQADQLTEGVTQLLDGSDKLYEGLELLLEQSGALVDGVNQLAYGAGKLQGGAGSLSTGAGQLSKGLSTLNANSAALNGGAQQVFETLLTTAATQIRAAGLDIPELTIGNYAQVLSAAIDSVGDHVYAAALEQVTAAVNGHREEIVAGVTEAVRQGVIAQVEPLVEAGVREQVTASVKQSEDVFLTAVLTKMGESNPGLPTTAEEYRQAVSAIPQEVQDAVSMAVATAMETKIQQTMDSQEVKAKIAALTQQKTQEQMETEEIKGLIGQKVEATVQQKISDTMASEEIQNKLQAAGELAKPIIELKTSLDSYNSFYMGLKTYTAGVGSAAKGAEDLRNGVSALKTGADTLGKGIKTLKDKTPALTEGITQLRDGSKALKDGVQKLMDEGISKIADLAEGDLQKLTDGLRASAQAAKSYRSFSGIQDRTEGTVKFVYKTDSVEAE